MKAARRVKRQVSRGIVFIKATFNNTIITVGDESGAVLTQSMAGRGGFKGARKGTPFAAQLAAAKALEEAVAKYGLESVEIRVKGPGAGRDSAIRAVRTANLRVTRITDNTPLAHNGCRPPKERRV